MDNENKTQKTYPGLKFDILNTPVNYSVTRTYSTIANPVVQQNKNEKKAKPE